MSIARARFALLALFGIALLPAPVAQAVDAAHALPLEAFPKESIAVETRSARRYVFQSRRAETPEQREQGLMFVKHLGAEEAMIFVYEPAQYVAMWMKNTILSLDMLFVDEQGCIVNVKERARPQSLDTIEAGSPVALVVELNAGTIAERGIRVGDKVARPEVRWPRSSASTCRPTR